MKTEALSSWQLSKSSTRLMLPSVCAVLDGSLPICTLLAIFVHKNFDECPLQKTAFIFLKGIQQPWL